MTTKGKQAKKPSKQVKDPEPLKLDELSLLKMEKLSTQVRAIDSELILLQNARAAHLAKVDPEGLLARMDSKIAALRQERAEAETEYKEVAAIAGEKLGVNLSEYAYDDKTGVLRKISNES